MRNKLLHYLIPIVGLIIVNFIYFYPAIQGKVISQSDILQGKATGHQIREYREANGEEPLWTQGMFSGMPAFQITTEYPNNWLSVPASVIAFVGGRMSGIHIIFTLMFGFYLLMISLKVNPWLSAISAVAFAFSAFFIISFGAGHNAKVRTAGFIAPVIMGVILAYNRKYLAGFALTALFVGLSINSNHFQVTYFMGLILLMIAIVEFIFAIREKTLNNFAKASGVLLLAGLVGVGPNISNLWSTYEYAKESIRGGTSELTKMKQSEGGLTWNYAMEWSYGALETFNLIIPNVTGGGSEEDYSGTETYKELHPRVVQNLTSQGVPKRQAEQQADRSLASLFYWGDQRMVNGAYYVGAVVFFLFVLGFFLIKGRMKWWVAAISLFAIMLALGKNLEWFNRFIFDHLPFYNKFRVPSYAFMMIFVVMPMFGFFAANKILKGDYNPDKIKKQLLYSLYITGGICLFFMLLGGSMFDFVGPNDQGLQNSGIDLGLLEDDRVSLMRSSALKTLIYCALTFGAIWLTVQKTIKPTMFIGALAVLIIFDQWSFDKQHLGADDFITERSVESNFNPTAADQTILQDPDIHYRVFNTTAGLTSDSYTSYYHNSIGGYHAAKLIRYQDLIDSQLVRNNMACYNMLNAKWFIVGDRQTGQKRAQQNPGALGNAWLVQEAEIVPNADAEMAALGDFDPKTTVIVDERYKEQVPAKVSSNPASSITLTSFDLKDMVYEADIKGGNEFAVFSEIFYEGGNKDWKTYIDNEPTDHIRVNYTLRGMRIPQGKHTIEFKFEPRSYYLGEKISLVFSIIMTLGLIAVLVVVYRENKETPSEA